MISVRIPLDDILEDILRGYIPPYPMNLSAKLILTYPVLAEIRRWALRSASLQNNRSLLGPRFHPTGGGFAKHVCIPAHRVLSTRMDPQRERHWARSAGGWRSVRASSAGRTSSTLSTGPIACARAGSRRRMPGNGGGPGGGTGTRNITGIPTNSQLVFQLD
jgi:hypothetical protein